MYSITRKALYLASILAVASRTAFATVGMNFEGYGPEAHGAGGASYAWDNGTAAVVNNPATLGLAPEGDRIDVAFGFLGPNVRIDAPGGATAKSGGTAYVMPAFGWSRRAGDLAWGFGIFAQGGMGTKYDESSFLALGSGGRVGSELTVGRAIVPLAWRLTDRFILAGAADFVWAGLDLQMAVPGSVAPGLARGGTLAPPPLSAADYLRIDFANDNPLAGSARGYGTAGRLGFVWQAHDRVAIGGVWNSRTSLSDLEASDADLSFGNSETGTETGRLRGKARAVDFQWPSSYGLGAAVRATKTVSVVADVKRVEWSDVMSDFNLRFDAGAPGTIDFALPQQWRDHTVVSAGVIWRATDRLSLRAGYTFAENPIPEATANPLFPAITEDHVTAGATYAFGDHAVALSVAIAPEVDLVNADGLRIRHSQANAQVMYTRRF